MILSRNVALLVVFSFLGWALPGNSFADDSSSVDASACQGVINPGSQKEAYCNAYKLASKSAKQSKTMMMVWGGVTAVCVAECAGNFGGVVKYLCPGAGLAAGATELMMARSLQKATQAPPPVPNTSWIDNRHEGTLLRSPLELPRASELARSDLERSESVRMTPASIGFLSALFTGVFPVPGAVLADKSTIPHSYSPNGQEAFDQWVAEKNAANQAGQGANWDSGSVQSNHLNDMFDPADGNVNPNVLDSASANTTPSTGATANSPTLDLTLPSQSGDALQAGGTPSVESPTLDLMQPTQTSDINSAGGSGGVDAGTGSDMTQATSLGNADMPASGGTGNISEDPGSNGSPDQASNPVGTQNSNADQNVGANPSQGGGLDFTACIAAAAAGVQTYMKYADFRKQTKYQKEYLKDAAQLDSTTQPVDALAVADAAPSSGSLAQTAPSSGSGATTSTSTGGGGLQSAATAASPSGSSGSLIAGSGGALSAAATAADLQKPVCAGSLHRILECASSQDANLPAFVTQPEFAARFERISGQSLSSFLQSADQYATPDQAIQAATRSAVAPRVSSRIAQVLNDYGQDVAYRSGSGSGSYTRTSYATRTIASDPSAPINVTKKRRRALAGEREEIPADAVLGTDADISRGVAPSERLPASQ